jgi:hypothetical protein
MAIAAMHLANMDQMLPRVEKSGGMFGGRGRRSHKN